MPIHCNEEQSEVKSIINKVIEKDIPALDKPKIISTKFNIDHSRNINKLAQHNNSEIDNPYNLQEGNLNISMNELSDVYIEPSSYGSVDEFPDLIESIFSNAAIKIPTEAEMHEMLNTGIIRKRLDYVENVTSDEEVIKQFLNSCKEYELKSEVTDNNSNIYTFTNLENNKILIIEKDIFMKYANEHQIERFNYISTSFKISAIIREIINNTKLAVLTI